MGAPRGGPRREKGKRGWGVEQTHSFIQPWIVEPALGSVQKDPGLGPILRALGFEEAQRCWLEGKGSGWSKVRALLRSVQLRNPGRMGEFRKSGGRGLVLQPGQTSLTSSWPSLHSSRGPLYGWGEAPEKENGEGHGMVAGAAVRMVARKGGPGAQLTERETEARGIRSGRMPAEPLALPMPPTSHRPSEAVPAPSRVPSTLARLLSGPSPPPLLIPRLVPRFQGYL